MDERGYKPGGMLIRKKVEEFWEKVNEFKTTRPHAQIINTETASPEDVSQQILKIVRS